MHKIEKHGLTLLYENLAIGPANDPNNKVIQWKQATQPVGGIFREEFFINSYPTAFHIAIFEQHQSATAFVTIDTFNENDRTPPFPDPPDGGWRFFQNKNTGTRHAVTAYVYLPKRNLQKENLYMPHDAWFKIADAKHICVRQYLLSHETAGIKWPFTEEYEV